jgi:hypothetical protein
LALVIVFDFFFFWTNHGSPKFLPHHSFGQQQQRPLVAITAFIIMVKSSSSTTSSSVPPTTRRADHHHHHSAAPPSTTMVVPSSSSSTPVAAAAANALPQIRHAGRVHIRGRIRRVWRPRRLELLSDGHLLFYDDSTNSSTSSPSTTNNRLKYTLRVTSARILDVMTIRDMHTGLPRGTYGFLIRGQRIATDGDIALLDHHSRKVLFWPKHRLHNPFVITCAR